MLEKTLTWPGGAAMTLGRVYWVMDRLARFLYTVGDKLSAPYDRLSETETDDDWLTVPCPQEPICDCGGKGFHGPKGYHMCLACGAERHVRLTHKWEKP